MTENTIDDLKVIDLGGVDDSLSLNNLLLKKTPHKNRHVKGYLRFKVVAGTKYWYYCRSVRTRGGQYKERAEYIGNADAIHEMKQAIKGRAKG